MSNLRSFRTTDTRPRGAHTHPEKRSWPWLVAAVFLCPCHIPILLAILGTAGVGGVLSRNAGVLFLGLLVAFGFAVWRAVAHPKGAGSCPACESKN